MRVPLQGPGGARFLAEVSVEAAGTDSFALRGVQTVSKKVKRVLPTVKIKGITLSPSSWGEDSNGRAS